MRDDARPSTTVRLVAVALLAAGCGAASAEPAPETGVAGAAVTVGGLDPVRLLSDLPASATRGWEVVGAGEPVPVTLSDIDLKNGERADVYAEAGFEAGARLSLARGDEDRIAVMIDRFTHAAAAREVGDWHLASAGVTLVDGVSRIGTTAEGVVVLQDLLVRVVAVGADAPDEDAVRRLMDAFRQRLSLADAS